MHAWVSAYVTQCIDIYTDMCADVLVTLTPGAGCCAFTFCLQFLQRKWAKELDYKLRKYLWAFSDNRIAVCFEYEYRDSR